METNSKIKDNMYNLLNGFCVGYLTFGREFGITEVVLFVIAGITFLLTSSKSKQKQ